MPPKQLQILNVPPQAQQYQPIHPNYDHGMPPNHPNAPPQAQYQPIHYRHDHEYDNPPLIANNNHSNCFAAMTCLACAIPITLAFLAAAMFFLSFRYSAEKDILLPAAYTCIGLFVVSCTIFAAYFCLRKPQPGDEVAAMNGLLCCNTCSNAAHALASCGLLFEICTD